jgi:hypothetical protein
VRIVNDQRPTDGTRLAAAILLEELSQLAARLAKRLRGPGELPPMAVARLAVEADRTLTRINRNADRLAPPAKEG